MLRSTLILAPAAFLAILFAFLTIFQFSFDEKRLNLSLFRQHGSNDGFETAQQYLLGVGKADITGPVVEINFVGYADAAQLGTGLRQRLYSRTFIIGDLAKPEDRFVYLVLDTASGDTAVRHGILEALAALGDDFAMYGQQNVAVTGTHSHSGPGAWLNYLLPQITSRGFSKQAHQAIVDGAVKSIRLAHMKLAPGYLTVGSIDIADANINRSPYAYLANPPEEREKYDNDVDKTLTMLRFAHHSDGKKDFSKDIGILTWFPVHGTGMYGNNTLVTGDNKGVAARLFEKSTNDPEFVAGFSQANVGDTSPNVLGAYCESGEFVGEQCDFKTSLCGNITQPCHGRGPYFGLADAGTASNYEIGRRQYQGARDLFNSGHSFVSVTGKVVKSFHRFVDLSTYQFPLQNGTTVKTCPAALGYSFAAGTTDGPGAFDFKQAQPGDPNANPFWSVIGNRIATPNETQIACHGDKVILLDVGESHTPYDWSPNIVDVQLLRVGNLFIVVSPGEATTMSGRRWREAIHHAARALPDSDESTSGPIVVLGGPANTYTHYIATPEEYSVQRYEGASTLYGPHTLAAHVNLTTTFLPLLDASASSRHPHEIHGPQPPVNVNRSLSFITGVVVDRAPFFKHFGDVVQDVYPFYAPGETVKATFVGANPRNNLRLGDTFAAVERWDSKRKVWDRVRDDADWSLVFEWERTSTLAGTSEVTVSWETKWENGSWRPEGEAEGGRDELFVRGAGGLAGLYRLRYYGDAKAIGGIITAFEGVSGEFRVR